MKIVIVIIVMAILEIASAATWDIGAVQKGGSATDIGAVQESVAVGGVVVTPYYYRGAWLLPLIPFSFYYWRRKCAA